MELRRGRVSNVRLGSELIAQSGKHGTNVSTHHYATFDLDGVPAQASAARPLTVSDGNDVVLAGKMKDGVFVAAACRNLTRGTIDHVSWWGGLVVGPVFVIAGSIGTFFLLQESGIERWFALIPVIFATVGSVVLLTSVRQLLATSAVRRWQGASTSARRMF